MMKKIVIFLFFCLSFPYASALACVDITSNLFRYEENEQVRLMQNFLYEKGYLKATPNGYYGPGTFAAVKAYQGDNGIAQTGVAGPLTRESIKVTTGCTLGDGAPLSQPAITTAELAQGWYYASYSGKKVGTPAHWVFTGQGTRSEMWKAPEKNQTTSSSTQVFTPPAKIECTDLVENLVVGNESSSVRSLQVFLYMKGYLKAVPNGYYGPGTFAAVKAYQGDNGIAQTGVAGPLTRVALKDESCGTTTKVDQSVKVTEIKTPETKPVVVPTTTTTTTKPIETTLTNNEKRWRDAEVLLHALYSYFLSSRGVWPIGSTSTTPIELCAAPRVTEMASSAEVAVLTTAASPCNGYADISYITPGELSSVPKDPSVSASSKILGYTILRSPLNEITIAPKVTDAKETIKVRCNFDAGCKTITKVSGEEFGVPFVTSLSRTLLLKDSLPKSGIIVTGRNFASATNTVFLQSKTSQRIYNLGSFPSTDGKTFTIAATTTSAEISCGDGCREKIPTGEYSVQVKTPGGDSNVMYITVKSFTTSSISARADATVAASSTNIKLGTITISTSIPVTLKSLTLRATSTSSKLPGKITNFKLKDPTANKTLTAGGLVVSLGDTSLPENNSRFYDIYADIGNVLVNEAGQVTYGGTFVVRDTIGGVDIELPMKEISFSVSP